MEVTKLNLIINYLLVFILLSIVNIAGTLLLVTILSVILWDFNIFKIIEYGILIRLSILTAIGLLIYIELFGDYKLHKNL